MDYTDLCSLVSIFTLDLRSIFSRDVFETLSSTEVQTLQIADHGYSCYVSFYRMMHFILKCSDIVSTVSFLLHVFTIAFAFAQFVLRIKEFVLAL